MHEISRTTVSLYQGPVQVISDPGLLTPGPSTRILVFDVTLIFRPVAHLFHERKTSGMSNNQINGTQLRPSNYRDGFVDKACLVCVCDAYVKTVKKLHCDFFKIVLFQSVFFLNFYII